MYIQSPWPELRNACSQGQNLLSFKLVYAKFFQLKNAKPYIQAIY